MSRLEVTRPEATRLEVTRPEATRLEVTRSDVTEVEMTTQQRDSADDDVTLVDAQDRVVGRADKLAAHRPPGLLHRAFSVFVHDGEGRLLLQQRAATKYHFAGLWSNACCSHPRVGEPVFDAAHRRLSEELGLRARELEVLGRFEYHACDEASGLVEREVDHVVLCRADGTPHPHPDEAAAVEWVALDALMEQIATGRRRVTPWFAPALEVVLRGGWPPAARPVP